MVATDVASRGIGMIENPSPIATPSHPKPWCFTLYSQALSSLRNPCLGSFVSYGSLSEGILDLRAAYFSCYTRNSGFLVS